MFDYVVSVFLTLGLPLLCLLSLVLMSAKSALIGGVLVLGGFLACVFIPGLELQPVLSGTTGINLYIIDVVSSTVLAGGVLRLMRQGRPCVSQMLLIGFGAILAISLVRGIIANGLQSAGNDFRPLFFLLSIALYFSTFSPVGKDWQYVEMLWLGMSGILVLIAIMRWVMGEVQTEENLWKGFGGYHIRVLKAYAAFVLAQTLLMLILVRHRAQRTNIPLMVAIIIAIVVLLLQHRTVWVALLGTGILIVWKDPTYRTRLGWVVLAGSIVLVVLAYLVGPLITSSLESSAREPFSEVSSLSWRIEGWKELLASMQFEDILIGKSFGGGYVATLRGMKGDVSPHSLCISILYRSGLLGLVVFVALYIRVLRDTNCTSQKPLAVSFLAPHIVFFLLTAQLLYGIGYFLHYEQGIVLGMGLAIGANQPVDSRFTIRSDTKRKSTTMLQSRKENA